MQKRRFATVLAPALLSVLIGSRAFAQEHGDTPAPHSDAMASSESTSGASAVPHLPADAGWVPPMLIIIAGLFVAARVIGPAVRAEMIEDAAAAADSHGHGHDDHGHGHSDHGHGH